MTFTTKIPYYPWTLYLTGGISVLGGYFLFDIYRFRLVHTPFFNPSAVVLVEEQARYPCSALKGMDVVVRNHYVRKPIPSVVVQPSLHNSPDRTNAVSVDNEVVTDVGKWNVTRHPSCAVFFSEMRHRLGRVMRLFSNETNTVNSSFLEHQRSTNHEGRHFEELSSPIYQERGNSDNQNSKGDLLYTRIIVDEAASPALGAYQQRHPDAKLGEICHQAGGQDSKLGADDTPPRQELVASAGWPPHTEKYVSLSLEAPQTTPGVHVETNDAKVALDALRRLTDRATHQSLVRCAPFSVIPGTNCEADPSYLGSDYLRVMLSAFLLLPSSLPSLRVGVLGVGGGSLPLFLLHYFSRSIHHLDLVDIEPMCICAAVQDLGFWDALNRHELALGSPEAPESGLSSGSPTTQVHLEDAIFFLHKHQGQLAGSSPPLPDRPMNTRPTTATQTTPTWGAFTSPSSFAPTSPAVDRAKLPTTPLHPPLPPFSRRSRQRPFDVLFVDLFLGSDLADGVASAEFLALCRASISSSGVVAFNLPARDRPFLQQCRQIFGEGNTYLLPCPSSANVVVLARGGSASAFAREGSAKRTANGAVPAPRLSHRVLYRRAMELSERHQLPFNLGAYYPFWWRFW